MSQYPIVKIPRAIEQAKSAKPDIPAFLEIPPVKPERQPKKWEITVLIGAALATSFTIVLFPQWLIIAMILIVGSVSYHRISYPQRLSNHRREIEIYIKNARIYEKKKRRHDEQLAIALSPEKIAEFQYNKLSKILQNTIPPNGRNSIATKVCAEVRFGEYLEQYFPSKTHDRLTLNIPNYKYPYTPDFAYIDPTLNLYIDIEIDEPYAYRSDNAHIPTHYQESWKDNNRNEFFLSRTWVVIRFSEEQIARHPDSCCKTIATVLCELVRDESYLKPFVTTSDLQPMEQWTHEEAKRMADANYRKTYLSRIYR